MQTVPFGRVLTTNNRLQVEAAVLFRQQPRDTRTSIAQVVSDSCVSCC